MGENLVGLVLDNWRAKKEGPEGIAHRQRDHLATMVAFSRAHSPLYERLYADLPEGPSKLELLPITTKKSLMGV